MSGTWRMSLCHIEIQGTSSCHKERTLRAVYSYLLSRVPPLRVGAHACPMSAPPAASTVHHHNEAACTITRPRRPL